VFEQYLSHVRHDTTYTRLSTQQSLHGWESHDTVSPPISIFTVLVLTITGLGLVLPVWSCVARPTQFKTPDD